MECIEPYSDDNMVYDDITGRYILTEKAFTDFGYDLRSQIMDGGYTSPDNIIKGFFRTVSDMVYAYIHSFSGNTPRQDKLIACVPSLRGIIMRAMLYQAAYYYFNGNGWLSTKPEERAAAIDMIGQDILAQTVPELGTSILYSGARIFRL